MRFKTFEQYDTYNGVARNHSKSLQEIISKIQEKGFELEDLYQTDSNISFNLSGRYPFSVTVAYDDATIIVEKDGITDNLGAFDINTELNDIVEVITSFE